MGKVHVNKGRVAILLVGVVISMAAVDSARREHFKVSTSSKVTVNGDFMSKSVSAGSDESTLPFTLDENGQPTTSLDCVKYVGMAEQQLGSDKMNQGLLVLADSAHPVQEGSSNEMSDLFESKNECYSLIEEGVMLNTDATEALHSMMSAYQSATGLNDFVVYGTTETYTGEGSYCPRAFAESVTGNTVDLALNGYASVISFDGYDAEGWILDNCARYGFIVRYPQGKEEKTGEAFCPWHLRYVGKLHAAVIEKNGFCLEEYLEFLKDYTIDEPFAFTYDGAGYEIYYVPSEGDTTTVMVPIAGNYSVSGNNTDGFIVTCRKS
ncbi:MAG: D-alanyl-D-alanine carboxypeptidase family protein [Ruminococcus sp.]|nr:D-alanyl-D-alanine carboxypeptidase family protein [Ruminococcus sp.]